METGPYVYVCVCPRFYYIHLSARLAATTEIPLAFK